MESAWDFGLWSLPDRKSNDWEFVSTYLDLAASAPLASSWIIESDYLRSSLWFCDKWSKTQRVKNHWSWALHQLSNTLGLLNSAGKFLGLFSFHLDSRHTIFSFLFYLFNFFDTRYVFCSESNTQTGLRDGIHRLKVRIPLRPGWSLFSTDDHRVTRWTERSWYPASNMIYASIYSVQDGLNFWSLYSQCAFSLFFKILIYLFI